MTSNVEALVEYRMERAQESLAEARLLAADAHWNTCANRLYYACFYAVNALLASQGLAASKHTGVRGLLGRHFVRTGRLSREQGAFYNDLFESRQESDYQDFFRIKPETVRPWIDLTVDFIREIEHLVGTEDSNGQSA